MQHLMVFDLDDTLVDTSHVYHRARQRFVSLLSRMGAPADEVRCEFELIDAANMKHLGFAPERYGRSMLATYQHFRCLKKVDLCDEERIRQCGDLILTRLPRLIDGARELLEWASPRYRLVLYTRGDPVLQRRKIDRVGIAGFFEDVVVTSAKTASELLDIIARNGSSPPSTWVIGDSIRSDINPGVEAGARCILYRYAHPSYIWQQEYGASATGSFYLVSELAEIPAVVSAPEEFHLVDTL